MSGSHGAETPRVLRILTRLNSGGIAGCVLTQAIHGIPGYQQVIAAGTTEENEVPMEPLLNRLEHEPFAIAGLRRHPAPVSDLSVVRELVRLIRIIRPSIVETHASKAGFVGRLAAAAYNRTRSRGTSPVRVLHYFHGHVFRGGYFSRPVTRSFLEVERRLARWATDLILVPAPHQRDELANEFGIAPPNRFRVVPHGMEIDRLLTGADRNREEFRRQLQLSDEHIAVGIVGRLEPVKDHPLFLRAAAHALSILPENIKEQVRFIIVGGGELRSELERMSVDMGLGKAVIFTGHRHDPERFYPGMDVVGLSSKNEGYPFALMEAMAFGLPVFSTSAGGVVDLIRPGETGLTTKVGDAEGLGKAIATLVQDGALRQRLGAAAQRDMRERHDLAHGINGLKSVYDEVMQLNAAHLQVAC